MIDSYIKIACFCIMAIICFTIISNALAQLGIIGIKVEYDK